jgi:hypothetical protein
MKKAVFTTAALAIGVGLVGGSAVAASAAGKGGPVAGETGPLGLMSQTEVAPAIVPAADTVTRLAREGNLTKGSAFDEKKPGKISGVYLDGMGRSSAKKPDIPVHNPVGPGEFQLHPLNAPTSAGLGSMLNRG